MDRTDSGIWRERGNQLFDKATDDWKKKSKQEYFEQALRCYGKAIEEADDDSDEVSATKNMALTEWKLASLGVKKTDYLCSALKHFSYALNQGKDNNSAAWVKKVEEYMNKCCDEAMDFMKDIQNVDERQSVVEKIEYSVENESVKCKCCRFLAEALYKEGTAALRGKNLKRAMDLFKESWMPLERARNLVGCKNVDLENKIQSAMTQIQVQMYIETARNLVKKATEMQTNGNVLDEDTVFGVIDACQQAMQIAGEDSFETEAECLTYLGLLYKDVLDQYATAKEYFMRSIQLCECMPSQSFILTEWHSTCTKNLESFQQEIVQEEERTRHEFIQKELKKEMAILKEGEDKYSGNIPGLLCYITKCFPLTETSKNLPNEAEIHEKEIKSICRKLVLQYHSDRQNVKDRKQKMLYEEITKVLNGIMETLKVSG